MLTKGKETRRAEQDLEGFVEEGCMQSESIHTERLVVVHTRLGGRVELTLRLILLLLLLLLPLLRHLLLLLLLLCSISLLFLELY